MNDTVTPKFKAQTRRGTDVPCNWCGHEHDIYDDPGKFLPDHNEDYEDEPKKCSKCGKTFFVSCEVSIDYEFVSRYRPTDEWEDGEFPWQDD